MGRDEIQIETCADPPFADPPAPNPDLDIAEAAGRASDAHPDVFAGAWWDGTNQQFVFPTVNVEQAASILDAELPPGMSYRLESVARNATELEQLRARTTQLRALGIPLAGSGRRVWDAVVEINLPILDESSLAAVREVFSADLDAICVTGADPAAVPPDGPQPTSSDGWTLLADQTSRGEPYTVHVAVNDVEYRALWAALALDTDPPDVDFSTRIVVHFGAVYSGSCPEIRLDGIVIDRDAHTLTADIVELGGDRICTADANPRAYVLAIDRDRLPPVPFRVSLRADCEYCQSIDVTA